MALHSEDVKYGLTAISRRLNYDGRGEYLGEFQSDDTILVVLNNGEFYTTRTSTWAITTKIMSASSRSSTRTRYGLPRFTMPTSRIIRILKRFCFEGSNQNRTIWGEQEQPLILLTDEYYPVWKSYSADTTVFRDPLVIDAEEFIAVKGFKAKRKAYHYFIRWKPSTNLNRPVSRTD